jgi:glycosyltransferase involved in cell wall biosynthesis
MIFVTNELTPSTKDNGHILSNRSIFEKLVGEACTALNHDRLGEAAIHASVAATHAIMQHGGLFASDHLDRVLAEIGRNLPAAAPAAGGSVEGATAAAKVLHVATRVEPVGGLTSLMLRWIRQDADRVHSIAITRQIRPQVPEVITNAVRERGGAVHLVNTCRGGVLTWALRLREMAREADIVVLHCFTDDVVPAIAFANKIGLPRIIYVDHNDHTFSLNMNIADLVVCLRQSGLDLARQRRGVSTERSCLLSTPLDPSVRCLPSQLAKQRLGLPEDAILLVSIARGVKFRNINGANYADAHVPILEKYPKAILIAVGPGERPDWAAAASRVPGRLISLPVREDVQLFQEAADIYVDSYPFVSITSLLEAGSLGVPLVSRFPYSDDAGILGADAPGLDGVLIHARTVEEYHNALSLLIADAGERNRLGSATRDAIRNAHVGESWRSGLERVYARALSLSPSMPGWRNSPTFCQGEPDCLLHLIHDHPLNLHEELIRQTRMMTWRDRAMFWLRYAPRLRLADLTAKNILQTLMSEPLACQAIQSLGSGSGPHRPAPVTAQPAAWAREAQ